MSEQRDDQLIKQFCLLPPLSYRLNSCTSFKEVYLLLHIYNLSLLINYAN